MRFKEILQKNIQFYRRYKNRNIKHKKTKISESDKFILSNKPSFETGVINIDNIVFSYSDAKGFLHSIDEIFGEEVYKFKSNTNNPLIIDCGANVGLSVYYFMQQYPGANIIAFEADVNIFKLLQSNVRQFENRDKIELNNQAVWTQDTELDFFLEGSLAGSLSLDFANKNQKQRVRAVDLKKYLNQKVDFLKIDIEGAENELIFHIGDSLKNVQNLFLEYHGLVGSSQNLGDILNLLRDQGFEYYIRLAAETLVHPFCKEIPTKFNQQLNIFCYRK